METHDSVKSSIPKPLIHCSFDVNNLKKLYGHLLRIHFHYGNNGSKLMRNKGQSHIFRTTATAASWCKQKRSVMYPKPLQPSQLCRPQWQQVQVDVNTQGLSYVFWNHGKHCCNCNNLMETTATLGASTAQSDGSIWVMSSTSIDYVATMATTMTTTAKSWWKTGLSRVLRNPLRPNATIAATKATVWWKQHMGWVMYSETIGTIAATSQWQQFDGNVIWVKSSIPNPLQPQRQLQADQWNVWMD